MDDSILNTIKKLLGRPSDYEHFDQDLITDINTALSILTQLGVGPTNGFMIIDESATWKDFLGDDPRLNMVKNYVHLKVKLLFDAQSMPSGVIDSTNKIIDELEFRMMVNVDIKRKESE